MNDASRFELRIATLLSAYADRAPTDVKPEAMALLAAAQGRTRTLVFGLSGADLRFVLLLLTLLATIVGGTIAVGSRLVLRDREEVLTERAFIEPFRGLAPEGAVPSTPETGELVLSFGGRLDGILDADHFRTWLFADGRVIWVSSLEGGGSANPAFGSTPPTTAVIEQHLTPEGVGRMRSEVLSSGAVEGPYSHNDEPSVLTEERPGVDWGGIALGGPDGRLSEVIWTDAGLPLRLADPGSWLPPSAWADRRIGGFVPTSYAVCPHEATLEAAGAPETVLALVRNRGTETKGSEVNGKPWQPDGCHIVPVGVAREIVAALEAAGQRSSISFGFLHYAALRFLPVLPHGEVICNCG